jgi:YegS/Rv2252/BmrU family lipid kinase
MKVVHFIVNPIAGKGKAVITEQYLSKYFEKKEYSIAVKHSKYKGHAKLLAEQSLQEKATIIVACGGDGTINEVASCLVHTKVALGIIPIGSGNGLARNLNISMNVEKAIDIIKKSITVKIDVGKINDFYFFSNAGIGFAANTILNFENSKNRRFLSYLKAFFKSIWSYRDTSNTIIDVNGEKEMVLPFLVLVSNTNEMGYNFSMTKKALIDDGLLDMVVIKKLSRIKMIYLGFLFLLGAEHSIREYSYHTIKNTNIEFEDEKPEIIFQIDGELKRIKKDKLQINVHGKSLNVIRPCTKFS